MNDTKPAVSPEVSQINEFRIIVGRKILNTKILPQTGESLIYYSPKAKMNHERSNGTFALVFTLGKFPRYLGF